MIMSKNKVFCLPLFPVGSTLADEDLFNYAYVVVTPKLEQRLDRIREMLVGIDDGTDGDTVVALMNESAAITLAFDGHEYASDDDSDVDVITKKHCALKITSDGFRFSIPSSANKSIPSTESGAVPFEMLDVYDDLILQIPLQYTSEWDDGQSITTECTMDSFSGALDIKSSLGATPESNLDREFVTTPDGREYSVFSNEGINGELFVRPSVLHALVAFLEKNDDERPSLWP